MAGGSEGKRRTLAAIDDPPVVADSSPLIALERIERLDILTGLFETIVIPPAVAREVGPDLSALPWITEIGLPEAIDLRVALAFVEAGESEAITLALALDAVQILVDDEPARNLAHQLGLPVIGTLGLLRTAKRRGLISEVQPLVDALVTTGFRVSPNLYRSFLDSVGEAPGFV